CKVFARLFQKAAVSKGGAMVAVRFTAKNFYPFRDQEGREYLSRGSPNSLILYNLTTVVYFFDRLSRRFIRRLFVIHSLFLLTILRTCCKI
ncbi:MAG: hypothetical protein ACI396_07425, partial [Acutalibacteraceae bacterium]